MVTVCVRNVDCLVEISVVRFCGIPINGCSFSVYWCLGFVLFVDLMSVLGLMYVVLLGVDGLTTCLAFELVIFVIIFDINFLLNACYYFGRVVVRKWFRVIVCVVDLSVSCLFT